MYLALTSFTSLFFVFLVQVLSLSNPPFGIMLGTPFLLPFLVWLSGKLILRKSQTPMKSEFLLGCIILTFCLSHTLDWFYAPGTHDMVGMVLMQVFGGFGSLFMLVLGVIEIYRRKKSMKSEQDSLFILCLLMLVLPNLNSFILYTSFSDNLNQTLPNIHHYL